MGASVPCSPFKTQKSLHRSRHKESKRQTWWIFVAKQCFIGYDNAVRNELMVVVTVYSKPAPR